MNVYGERVDSVEGDFLGDADEAVRQFRAKYPGYRVEVVGDHSYDGDCTRCSKAILGCDQRTFEGEEGEILLCKKCSDELTASAPHHE